jgi:hypothetical protein
MMGLRFPISMKLVKTSVEIFDIQSSEEAEANK